MKKIFFFDIDGTLAINGKVPASNIKALEMLKEKGFLTFICSGRVPFYIDNLFKDLISGYIACNGRYIAYNNQKIFSKPLLKDDFKGYIKQIDSVNGEALFASDEFLSAHNLKPSKIRELKEEYGSSRIKEGISSDNYYTFDLFYDSLEERDMLVSLFEDTLIINDHGGYGSCDCSTRDFGKGHAINYLLNYLSISKDKAYAFGDGYNDLSMFNEVGHAIAMGNAVDSLKEKATYITDNIENDGIMKALKAKKIL